MEDKSEPNAPPFGIRVQPTKGAPILRLPDELLFEIVSWVTQGEDVFPYYSPKFKSRAALAQTCARFCRLATPSLYQHLFISLDYFYRHERRFQITQLHRTLAENPPLRRHCRRLRFSHGGSANKELVGTIVLDLVRWLTQTREFSVHGGFQEEAGPDPVWDSIRVAAEHMPHLEEVTLSRHDFVLPVQRVFGALSPATNLKTLCLAGCYPSDIPWDTFEAGSSAITSLTAWDFCDSPANLEKLLSWPARLESFRFGTLNNTDFKWPLSSFPVLLSRHKTSLKALEIGDTLSHGLEGFDLTGFEALEKLELSYFGTGSRIDPSWGLLNASRLREFCWRIVWENQGYTSISYFSRQEETWLRELAAVAQARKVPLQKLVIRFDPEPMMESEGPDVYPWDRMAHIQADLRPVGISVSYDAPRVSKEEFESMKHIKAEDRFKEWGGSLD
ncbi:hypothetical protein QBC34DRAFT_478185 [Podospora aff. communis PSN243]|uniref:F-box domain-containing protein n=1 Tax=Podospora aff. communis PSN243 TaxID=3040156 RepID=A0AAV9G2L8_9PEZI|nr:hypothetical protein QBC34DRAFT_478185 [Podospora aff. communis PSN243]